MKSKFNRVYIEITNICNLNCSFCPKNNRPKTFMTTTQFEHCTNLVAPLTDNIYLHLMGEPLLHPNLQEILSIAKKYNLNVNLTTNGTLLNKNIEILKLGYLRKLTISLHSFEANNSSTTIDNYLQMVIESVKEINSATNTIIEFRLWNNNFENLTAKNSLNNKIISTLKKAFNTKIDLVSSKQNYTLQPNIFLGFDHVFDWPVNSAKNSQSEQEKFCFALRTHFGILCDGTVVPCCLDSEGQLNLGNIFSEDITNILNNEKSQQIYNNFSNRKAICKLCKTCQYATRFDK